MGRAPRGAQTMTSKRAGRPRKIERGAFSKPVASTRTPASARRWESAAIAAARELRRGVSLPAYLEKALEKYAHHLDEHQLRVITRTLVAKEPATSIQRHPPAGESA